MTIWLLVLAIGGATVPLPSAVEEDEALFCSGIKDMSARATSDAPIMVDRVTRFDRMTADCNAREVVWTKSITADLASLDPGWRDGMQRQWNGSMCGNSLFAAMLRKGWRFSQELAFRSGEQIVVSAAC